ncbi:hypothetical protein NSP_25680 [Nodularia spumigena CCY9414]|nr:hypothetical protein NSP_25680 [Nodularia spumigena CCY9414]
MLSHSLDSILILFGKYLIKTAFRFAIVIDAWSIVIGKASLNYSTIP